MTNLNHWKQKIQERRKKTPFSEYLKEIGSWYPLVLSKDGNKLSRYPITERVWKLSDTDEYEEMREWFVDSWLDYDESISFLENYGKLFRQIPHPRMLARNSENCDYVDDVISSKDSYLSFMIITDCSNNLYSLIVKENCHNIINSINILNNCSNIFMSNAVMNSHNIFYSSNIINSSDVWFSSNLMACTHCIFCDWLEWKKYHIENKEYSKEEYKIKKEEILKDKNNFIEYRNKVGKKLTNFGSTEVTGNSILESTNVENGNYLYRVHGGRNLIMVAGSEWDRNIYDAIFAGSLAADDMYGVMICGINTSDIYCSYSIIDNSSNVFYSYALDTCSYCIGCIWLKNKSYCILNKQYTKEQWEILANKIFASMEDDGTLWDFFSPDINPFYFNDTFAWLIGNHKKEEIEKEGYLWREDTIKVDVNESWDIISTDDLDEFEISENNTWNIKPEILKKVIQDNQWNYYRIVKPEYDFLMKHWLPLPRDHWFDRIKSNFWITK